MRIRRQEGYLLQKIGNTHYLLPYGQKIADQQRGMELNETARILWEALETPKTMEELQQKMIRCYEVPEEEQEELKKDIQAFVKELLWCGTTGTWFSGWNLRRRIEDRRNFHCCLWKRGLHSKTVCFF